MLLGWIFFIGGLFLNALVLVVLVNRDQLTHLGAQLKRHSQRDQAQPTIPQGINTYRQRGERQLNRGDRNNIASTLALIFHQRLTGGLPKNLTKALGIASFIR